MHQYMSYQIPPVGIEIPAVLVCVVLPIPAAALVRPLALDVLHSALLLMSMMQNWLRMVTAGRASEPVGMARSACDSARRNHSVLTNLSNDLGTCCPVLCSGR